jgi:hypothetical protein
MHFKWFRGSKNRWKPHNSKPRKLECDEKEDVSAMQEERKVRSFLFIGEFFDCGVENVQKYKTCFFRDLQAMILSCCIVDVLLSFEYFYGFSESLIKLLKK